VHAAIRVQVVHDKGTYDAWRLGDNPHGVYQAEVWRVLAPGGLLVLSAVNWTVEELQRLFCEPAGAVVGSGADAVDSETPVAAPGGCLFEPVKVLAGSSFKFGGVVGHNVVTVVFRKVGGGPS
jgi:hypothetical protein